MYVVECFAVVSILLRINVINTNNCPTIGLFSFCVYIYLQNLSFGTASGAGVTIVQKKIQVSFISKHGLHFGDLELRAGCLEAYIAPL